MQLLYIMLLYYNKWIESDALMVVQIDFSVSLCLISPITVVPPPLALPF